MTLHEDNAVAILSVALDEQRRFHDEITASFESQKNRIVYFIGAILASMTFLYAGALDDSKSMREKLFIPEELYGILFYFFGLTCIVYSLAVLFRGLHNIASWHVFSETTEKRVIGEIDRSMSLEEYLQEMVNGYEESTAINMKSHAIKVNAVKAAFIPMVTGVTILIVLRFFQ